MIHNVPAADLAHFLPFVYPFLRLFERETQYASAESLIERIRNKERQLWIVANDGAITGVVLTEVYETPRGRMLCVWAAAGFDNATETIVSAYETIERWAREIGCVAVEVRGRKGWKRLLPDFKEVGVILEKELNV